MKYAPKKVFIKENGIYIEITNEEHESRKATDEQYAKRKFLPLHGMLMEVDKEFYDEFYRQKDRDEYLTLLSSIIAETLSILMLIRTAQTVSFPVLFRKGCLRFDWISCTNCKELSIRNKNLPVHITKRPKINFMRLLQK